MSGHTQRQWEGKFFRCQMSCWYCRIPLVLFPQTADEMVATKDHLTPVSRGGSDAISNIVPACIVCNRLKGDLTEEEFRNQRTYLLTTAHNSTSSAFSEPQPKGEGESFQIVNDPLRTLQLLEELAWASTQAKEQYAAAIAGSIGNADITDLWLRWTQALREKNDGLADRLCAGLVIASANGWTLPQQTLQSEDIAPPPDNTLLRILEAERGNTAWWRSGK